MRSNPLRKTLPLLPLATVLLLLLLPAHNSPGQQESGHGSHPQQSCHEHGHDGADCCNNEPLKRGFKCCGGIQIPEDWLCCDDTPAPPGSTCCETNEDCSGCTECKNFHCQPLDPSQCCDGERLPPGYTCCDGFAIPNDWICCDGTPAPPGYICCETDEDCPNCHQCKNFHCQQTKSYGEPDCCDPCEAAEPFTDTDPSDGSVTVGYVACCKGRPYACVNEEILSLFYKNEKALKIISDCIKLHEEVHFDDVDCSKNEGPRAHFKEGVDPAHSEYRAYGISIECLKSKKIECESDNDCINEVQEELKDQIKQIIRYANEFETLPP